jgi:MFS family permease
VSGPVDRQTFSLRSIAVPAFGPSLLFGLGEGAILPVIALTARDLGATVAGAALIVTLIGIGSLLSNIPASVLTARYGERVAIVAAACLSTAAMLLCVFGRNVWLFSIGIFLVGAASAVFNLARQSYLTEAVPAYFRARALSTLGGVMRIGVFIGPFAGALAIHFAGLSGAYWVGVVAVLLAGVVAWTMPDLPAVPAAPGTPTTGPTVRSILTSHGRVFVTVGIGVLLVSAVRSSRQVVLPLWAENIGLDPTATSVIYGLSGAIDMLVFYPAGKLMDRKGRSWVAIPSMLLMGTALLLMPLTGGYVSLLLVALLIGFGNGIGSGMIMTLGADYSPSPGRPQFLGIWRFLADIGSTGGPALLSGITAVAALAEGIAATGVLGLAAAVVLWYWIPRTPTAASRLARSRSMAKDPAAPSGSSDPATGPGAVPGAPAPGSGN